AAAEVSARRRRVHRTAWAASIVAAVAAGWTANHFAGQATPPAIGTSVVAPAAVARQAVVNDSRSPAATTASGQPDRSGSTRVKSINRPARKRSPVSEVKTSQVDLPPATAPAKLELTTVDIPRTGGFELDGMWRTMSWVGAQEEAGDKLPHIDGLPVVQVQVQASRQGKQPLMVVAQQLSSGEVIRTIEGPASDVSHLLARRTMSDPAPTRSSIDSTQPSIDVYKGVDGTMAMQRGDRMIAITGALPPDSLLAMIRRLNAEMRSK
ncbi:MAG TPA: hypothetical protein VJ808_03035, partial [Gemmatimonadales bacterium]|nr:hypothetical protein [Gemmatimonadales bacterium]